MNSPLRIAAAMALLAASTYASAQAAADPQRDIVGVRLGMTPAEATSAIKSNLPAAQISVLDIRLDSPVKTKFPAYIIATHQTASAPKGGIASGDVIAISISGPPSPPKVIEVQRFVRYPRGQELSLEQVQQSLAQKYGRANQDPGSNGTRFRWGSTLRDCQDSRGHSRMGGLLDPVQADLVKRGLLDSRLALINNPSGIGPVAKCGQTLEVLVSAMNSSGAQLVGMFTATLVDWAATVATTNSTSAALQRTAAQQGTQANDEAKKRGTPKL